MLLAASLTVEVWAESLYHVNRVQTKVSCFVIDNKTVLFFRVEIAKDGLFYFLKLVFNEIFNFLFSITAPVVLSQIKNEVLLWHEMR